MQEANTTKYVIHANIHADGVVEKSDVVGAIFGQTEGLLGDELDLRDLQKSGRIGRIEVKIDSKGGKSNGVISIPSSLGKVETAILAAGLETIERVGPCIARIEVTKIEDTRAVKRKKILERAIKLIREKFEEEINTHELIEEVMQSIRVEEITYYNNLPAGPNIENSDAILVVEGRADVLNLLKYGIKNVIGVEGTNISPVIGELSRQKTVTAFIDGDRGGELLLKELLQVADIDYVAVAPEGKSVEELTYKEITKALRNKTPVEQIEHLREGRIKLQRRKYREEEEENTKKERRREFQENSLMWHMSMISGSLNARLLDANRNVIKEVTVRDLLNELREADENVKGVVFDGVITQRIVDIADSKKLDYIVGVKKGSIVRTPVELRIISTSE